MDKVYHGCMLVDEKELDILIEALGEEICLYDEPSSQFNEQVKVYVKLLKEKESIQNERAKHESQTESI